MMTAHTTRFDSVALQVFCKVAAFPLAFPVHSYPQPKQTVNLLFPRFEGFDSVRHRSQPMKKSAFSPTPCTDFVTPQFFTQDQPAYLRICAFGPTLADCIDAYFKYRDKKATPGTFAAVGERKTEVA